ncbi:spaetzle domain-containing protein 4 isoform X1 [Halictus rubicundus]|uniref:spaetzle domain-containing protein 4 isoform X1 n=1 Tax=Halictus rubicundus TaxID=77578 RepID=UPI0040362566
MLACLPVVLFTVSIGLSVKTIRARTSTVIAVLVGRRSNTLNKRQTRVMNVIVSLVLQVIIYQLVRCQGSGGPSTFGYDASSACSKPYSRSGRARFTNLPCDFRRQNWCTVAGSAYPWHAVRRFVQENQGLMRRMYGDERHFNVLRAEFEKNDIELKYDDYYNHFTDDHRKYQYTHDYEYIEDEDSLEVNGDEYEGRDFTSRSFNNNPAKRLNKFPKLSEYTRPHFRPTEKSTISTSTTVSSSTAAASSTVDPLSSTPATSTTVSTTHEPTTKSASSTTTLTTGANHDRKENRTEEMVPATVATQVAKEQNFSINEISEQTDKAEEEPVEIADVVEVSEANFEETSIFNLPGTTELPDELDSSGDLFATPKETTVQETTSSNEQQEFRPRPEYRPAHKPEASFMKGQLYQDVAAKEQQEQPVLKLRGINACPVKEEVVAPFWANNTRGEVLALLNLYPFEQYVHWEKCTHENKQMYCRDGCKCEQQYRLHRLLAYDPNNECRGIFSDWFKFPSCCVCRCYDLPLEFRVTSRSPRTQKQRIKVRPPRDNYS